MIAYAQNVLVQYTQLVFMYKTRVKHYIVTTFLAMIKASDALCVQHRLMSIFFVKFWQLIKKNLNHFRN